MVRARSPGSFAEGGKEGGRERERRRAEGRKREREKGRKRGEEREVERGRERKMCAMLDNESEAMGRGKSNLHQQEKKRTKEI